jgi:O-antigen ligase
VSFGLDRTVGRWEKSGFWDKERALNYEMLVAEFIPESGWWGHGPGTFEAVFDRRRQAAGKTAGVWAQAHSDILQTPVDYGWAGAAAWTVIIGGALLVAAAGARRRGRRPDESEILSMACAFALAGVSLHALVDFPLQISSLQLYTVIIAGLAWGAPRPPKPGGKVLSL